MKTLKEKQVDSFAALKSKFKYTNVMQSPKVQKVVVSAGIGSIKDKKKVELVADRLMKITGQKAVLRTAKKSIASYKSREGDPMGYQVTLRGEKMWNFLEKLVHIALPRTKDFRGLPNTSVDAMGNYSIGIKEHSIFPEATDEELKDVFGLGITVVTNVKGKEEARTFLEHLGFPIKKQEAVK